METLRARCRLRNTPTHRFRLRLCSARRDSFQVSGFWPKVLLGVFPLGLVIALIGVCVSRIREIQGGEEDDLSHY